LSDRKTNGRLSFPPVDLPIPKNWVKIGRVHSQTIIGQIDLRQCPPHRHRGDNF